jgi:hypothetical protein
MPSLPQISPPVPLEHLTSDSVFIGLRNCSKCAAAKPLTEFFAEKRGRLGRRYSCKACDKVRMKAYAAARTKPRVRQRKSDAEYSLTYRKKHRAKELVRHARKRAEKMGIPFDLDPHIQELQKRIDRGMCELTGLPMPVSNGRQWDTPSIDRIEPTKGYVLSNIRVVCLAVNCALGFWGPEVLLKIADAIRQRRR